MTTSTASRGQHPVVEAQSAHRMARIQLRIADAITAFAGSMPFVYLHAAVFAAWMLFLEAEPWPTLTLVVSLEAIFLSTFVMIGQNRQAAFQQAKARPRLRGAGDGTQDQHRDHPGDPHAHGRAAPPAARRPSAPVGPSSPPLTPSDGAG